MSCCEILFSLLLKGSPFLLPGKICGLLNPKKNAKWENQACNQRLGYICKKGSFSSKPDIMPKGRLVK